MSSDDIYDDRFTEFKFSYFVKSTTDYDPGGTIVYRPGINPMDPVTWVSDNSILNYEIPVPTAADFSITLPGGVADMSDLESGALSMNTLSSIRDAEGNLTIEATNPAIKAYKIVQDIPLYAGWTLYGASDHAWYINRSQLMYAPAYDITGNRDTDASITLRQVQPFTDFRKVNSLVITGLPAFGDNELGGGNFMNANSDFTYTCFRSTFGIGPSYSEGSSYSSGIPLYASLSNDDLNTGKGEIFNGTIDEKDYLNTAIIPNAHCGFSFLTEYYDNLPEKENHLKGYARQPYNALACRVDFAYQVDTNGFGSLCGHGASPHPADSLPVPGAPDFFGMARAGVDMGTKMLNYKIAHASSGRLGPGPKGGTTPMGGFQAIARPRTGQFPIGTEERTYLDYFAANTPGASSGDPAFLNVTHKLVYPLPYDGTQTLSPTGGGGFMRRMPDCTLEADDDILVTADTEGYQDLEYITSTGDGGSIILQRESHQQAAESNIYRMFWGAVPGAAPGHNTQKAAERSYYGTNTYSLIYAFMYLHARVQVLQSAWTFDDTPKEARIRVQKSKKFIPEDFTGIKGGLTQIALDSGFIETNLGPTEQFDPVRSRAGMREIGDRSEGEFIIDGEYVGDRELGGGPGSGGGSGGGYS